jgi:hypothetical protein
METIALRFHAFVPRPRRGWRARIALFARRLGGAVLAGAAVGLGAAVAVVGMAGAGGGAQETLSGAAAAAACLRGPAVVAAALAAEARAAAAEEAAAELAASEEEAAAAAAAPEPLGGELRGTLFGATAGRGLAARLVSGETGREVARAPVQASGDFAVPDVPAGCYDLDFPRPSGAALTLTPGARRVCIPDGGSALIAVILH